jgi:hypothetical protein
MLGFWRAARSRVLWVLGVSAAALLAFWCYLRLSQTLSLNSDAAGQVLQGWQMLHGNPLLRGWFLSDVSFYTFEVPLDGLVATVHGLGPTDVNIGAALIYTLLVLVAALLAKGRARGREGLVRALLAAGILVAPVLNQAVYVMLLAADHTGIGVPVMLTLLFIDLVPERWWAPVVACVLLIWAQLDDPVATYAGAVPLAVVCAVRAAFSARSPGPRRWYDAALAVAAVSSYGLTRLMNSDIRAAGGFYVFPSHALGIARASAIPHQLQVTGQNALLLFSANFWGARTSLDAALGYLHLAGVAVALCGLLLGVWGLFFRLSPVFGSAPSAPSGPSGSGGPGARADRVSQALAVGACVMLAASVFGAPAVPVHSPHEIVIVLPLTAVLGGRLVGPWLSGARQARVGVPRPTDAPAFAGARAGRWALPDVARIGAASVLAVAGACYLAGLGYTATRAAAQPKQSLAGWLVAHRLTSGLAGYWVANVTSLTADGRVRIAAVNGGGTEANAWESAATWYNPAVSSANFVVVVSATPSAVSTPPLAAVRAFYGKPGRTYRYGQYTVLVYNHNLLRDLHRFYYP